MALDDYDEAVVVAPGDADLLNGRCYVRAREGRELNQALADCNESLRLRPNDGPTLDSRALVDYRLGEFSKAIDDATATLAQPNLETNGAAGARFLRGCAERRLGSNAAGDADIAEAKQMFPNVASRFAGYGVQP